MGAPRGVPPDWTAIRLGYPGAIGRAYFDTACMGLPSPAAGAALSAHTAMLRDPPPGSTTDLTVRMLEQFGRARVAAAALIGAGRDEIALVPSTGAAIETVALALQLPAGAHVLASDLEFVGTVLPWRLLEQRGISLRLVPHRDGRVEVSDLETAVDSRTQAVVVSSVQEVNGFRVDLDDLSRMCRSRGLLLIVDAIQHVGPLLLDVAATPVDAVAVGGHKWLCAPFGMGFLYTSPALLERLEPPSRSFMTARPPTGGWREYLEDPARRPDDPLEFPNGADKLELAGLGTSMAAAGLAAAIETLLRLGPAAIARRSRELVNLTVLALEQAGAEVVTPRTGPRSSIVTFRSGETIESERQLVAKLSLERIFASLRFTTGVGGIRVSPYFYNDEDDIERLAAVVRHELAGRRRRSGKGVSAPRLRS
jgi:cysteine desulfurase / selenocysteine lyase